MFQALTYSLLLLIGTGPVLSNTHEVFREELTLRPHADGTLLSHFAFTTTLSGTRPRVPHQNLTEDDRECWKALLVARSLNIYSAALQTGPSSLRPDSP